MPTTRERKRPTVLLLNSVDRLGRTIEPSVLAAAQEIATRAVSQGTKVLRDPALALSLLEEAAATVSKTLAAKVTSLDSSIRDMKRYLFRVYLRRISAEKKSTVVFEDSTKQDWAKYARRPDNTDIDRDILLRDVLESCDTLTREIFYLKLEGCSWKEIEKRCGISANAATLRFSRTLRQLRKSMRTRGR